MAITLTQLTTFLALVRKGTVTGAAEELVVTQPSVSAALAALSREIGVGLTEKSGRNVRLTAAGLALAPFAAQVLGLLDQGKQAAREAAEGATRQVRIAAVTTAAECVVPPLLHAFAERHPEIELTVDIGNRHRVFQRLRDYEADVGIGGRPPQDGVLIGVPFLANELVLITSSDDWLARRRSVPLEQLVRRTWLLREEGSGTRKLVEDFLSDHGLKPQTLTLGSNGAIKTAVRLGLGVSLQSRAAVELELESGALASVRLREELPSRRWYVLRPSAAPLRPATAALLEFVASPKVQEAVLLATRMGRESADYTWHEAGR